MFDELQLDDPSEAIFAALIDGLRHKKHQVRQGYLYAFAAIGPKAIPRLEAAIEHGRFRAAHRRALQAAIVKAKPGEYRRIWVRGVVPHSRSDCVLLVLLYGLQSDDAGHRELILAALRELGGNLLKLLVDQAVTVRQKMPDWCLRLLCVAAQEVDDMPGRYTIMDLERLAAHENAEISEQAKRVLERVPSEDRRTVQEFMRAQRELFAAQGITIE